MLSAPPYHSIAYQARAFYDPMRKTGDVPVAREQRKLAASVRCSPRRASVPLSSRPIRRAWRRQSPSSVHRGGLVLSIVRERCALGNRDAAFVIKNESCGAVARVFVRSASLRCSVSPNRPMCSSCRSC
jgi:hypothetical protein